MCLNLNVYQFKTSRCSYRSTYMNPMVSTNQRPIIDSQKLKRKDHKHTTTESNHKEKTKKKKRTKKNYKNNKKTNKKTAISTFLSRITLKINGLNARIKGH